MTQRTGLISICLAFALCFAGALSASALEIEKDTHSIAWLPEAAYGSFQVTLSGPSGVLTYDFKGSDLPYVELFDLADGPYTWELKAYPAIDDSTRGALAKAREAGDKALGRPVSNAVVETGYITIEGGALLLDTEEIVEKADSDAGFPNKDQVFLDDLIVEGSACVGLDCVNGENFGFDTLRPKENNLRIKFQDTSASASFPSNDWQITANGSNNGDANRFSIDDIDGAKTPFTIEAGAPSHSLYVDDAGNIGVNKSTPVVELHITDGDSPTVRLEQDGSSGFTPQTWDLAGNETNFFVRDVTNGSRLPFKILPSAPTNSLYVAADGDIGLGTASPDAGLHIIKDGVKISPVDDGTAPGDLLELEDESADNTVQIRYRDQTGDQWVAGAGAGDTFTIFDPADAAEFILTDTGNLTVTGDMNAMAFNVTSDVNAKENFKAVDAQQVLSKVLDLSVSTWNFIGQPEVQHLGPMAQDFHAAFGLGTNEVTISSTDMTAVALASIQGLNEIVEEKDAEIAELKERLAALEAAVTALTNGQ